MRKQEIRFIRVALSLTALLLASQAVAVPKAADVKATQGQPSTVTPAGDDVASAVGDEAGSAVMECRAMRVTGSRQRRKACHTRAEWAAMRRNGNEATRVTQQVVTMHFENECQVNTGNGFSCGGGGQ